MNQHEIILAIKLAKASTFIFSGLLIAKLVTLFF